MLVACGTNGPGEVIGTVHGMAVPVEDAVSTSITDVTSQGTTIQIAMILMANTSDLVHDTGSFTVHPAEKSVLVTLFDATGTVHASTGTYTIAASGSGPPMAATLVVTVLDGACQSITTSGASATSGTVDVTEASGRVFQGSFDVVLDSGDHITGTFHPHDAVALEFFFPSPPPLTCR